MTNKIKCSIIVSFIGIAGFSTLNGCGFEKMEVPNSEYIYEYGKDVSLEPENYLANSEEYLNDVVVETNIVIESGKTYPAVGNYEITLSHGKEISTISINIVDTIPPAINDVRDIYPVDQFGTLNLAQFEIEDLSEYTIEIDDSSVDYANAGMYKAMILARDKSDNETLQEIIIEVLQGTVSLDDDSVSIKVGESYTLKPTVENISGNVIFESNNTDVATVDNNGVVKGMQSGTAVIVASINNVNTECTIYVNNTSRTTSSEKTSDRNNAGDTGSSNSSGTSSGTSGLTHHWSYDPKTGEKIEGSDHYSDAYGNIYDVNGNPTGENIWDF